MDNFGYFSTNVRPQYQNSFVSKYIFLLLFSTLNCKCLGTCVFGIKNCVMPKQASVQLLHGQMKLDIPNLHKETVFYFEFILNCKL